MFGKLLGPSAPKSRAPDGVRIYAVGDIHGRSDLLDKLLVSIAGEEKDGVPAQLVFLGDYLDRGPDSRGVVERLISLGRQRPETVFLKGNHEGYFLNFLDDPVANPHWIDWEGADETMWSYGVRHGGVARDQVVRALNEQMPPAHREFLRSLELTRVFGDYLFVHAGLKPGVPLEEQNEQDLLWIRGEFHRAPEDLRPDKVVVHGHQPIKKPVDVGWRIGVDTGAFFTGVLTAVVLEGTSRRFLST